MGYTQYWNTKPTVTKSKWDEFIKNAKIVLENPTCPLVFGYDQENKKPVLNGAKIRFNGIGEDGHETFYIMRKDKPATWADDQKTVFGFCKTARKPYDKYVVASLILAKIHLGNEITLSSDGDLDDWKEGLSVVNEKLGKNYKLIGNLGAEYQTISEATIREETSLERAEKELA